MAGLEDELGAGVSGDEEELAEITVFFVDGTYESLLVPEHITAHDLKMAVCHKLRMPEDKGPECFGLWCVGDDVELELGDDHFPFDYLDGWDALFKEYSNIVETKAYRREKKRRRKAGLPHCNIYLRRTALLSKKYERKFGMKEHAVVVQLLWVQAHEHVMAGYFTRMSEEDCIELAALWIQSEYGDHNDTVHKPGFVELGELIPQKMLKAKKKREWEVSIYARHLELTGKERTIAQLLYLQYVRQWRVYGSTFFENIKYKVSTKTMFKHPFEGGVIVAVNADGITMIDQAEMKYEEAYYFSEITFWKATESTLMLTTTEEDGSSKKHEMETYQAKLIIEIVDAALDDIAAETEFVTETAERQDEELKTYYETGMMSQSTNNNNSNYEEAGPPQLPDEGMLGTSVEAGSALDFSDVDDAHAFVLDTNDMANALAVEGEQI